MTMNRWQKSVVGLGLGFLHGWWTGAVAGALTGAMTGVGYSGSLRVAAMLWGGFFGLVVGAMVGPICGLVYGVVRPQFPFYNGMALEGLVAGGIGALLVLLKMGFTAPVTAINLVCCAPAAVMASVAIHFFSTNTIWTRVSPPRPQDDRP